MDGTRRLYRFALSPLLCGLGIVCTFALVTAAWGLVNAPSVVGFIWTSTMAIGGYLSFTNAYRAFSGRARLEIEDKVERVAGWLCRIPMRISAVPVFGPPIFALLFTGAATATFATSNEILWHLIQGRTGALEGISVFRATANLYMAPVLDSTLQPVSLALSSARVLLALLLVNALFAIPARRHLTWSPTRILVTTHGPVLVTGVAWLAIAIAEDTPAFAAGAMPYLLLPTVTYWQAR